MSTTTTDRLTLQDTAWAMRLLNYSPERRNAFWFFVHANNVPHIRIGPKKILFSEQAVFHWLASRSSTGKVA